MQRRKSDFKRVSNTFFLYYYCIIFMLFYRNKGILLLEELKDFVP